MDPAALAAAEPRLRAALRARPADPAAAGALGTVLAALGRHAEAEPLLHGALARQPGAAALHANLGRLLHATGRGAEAARHFRRALRLDAAEVSALAGLAALARAAGDAAAAVALLEQACRRRPGDAALAARLGAALREADRPEQAARLLRRVAAACPDDRALRADLAAALHEAGEDGVAEPLLRGLLAAPGAPGAARLTLAAVCVADGRHAEAEALARAAPATPEALALHGQALRGLGRLAESAAAYRAALALRPGVPEAEAGLGLTLLAAGDPAGWAAHEARLRARPWVRDLRHAGLPAWQGGPLRGRTLLVHAEQGLGDTLQFCRFVPLLPRDGRVILEVQPALARLLGGLPGVDTVLPRGAALPAVDVQVPLMSLPHRLGIPPLVPPPPAPLPADPAPWRARLGPGRWLGIAWAGNPRMRADARRSLPAAALAPLLSLPGWRVVSLQKDRAAPAGVLAPPLGDVADTAGLVAALDLVVSVDTAVAHLAGTLGRPVWLLNRADPCWRWGLGREDSPWYPSLRQLRQAAPGDWAGVVARVAAALSAGPPATPAAAG